MMMKYQYKLFSMTFDTCNTWNLYLSRRCMSLLRNTHRLVSFCFVTCY